MFFHKDTKEKKTGQPGEVNGDSSVAEWLDHPAGGVIFRTMLKDAGQSESVLRPVRRLALKRLVAMSQGKFTPEMMEDMIRRANSGEVSQDNSQAAATEEKAVSVSDQPLPEWQEKLTNGRFSGKTVIVTGAGSGIGRATASRVAREGGKVIAVDISQERLDDFKSETPDTDIIIVVGDITNDESIKAIVAAAEGAVDALANVAGIMDNMTPLHEVSDEVWSRVMNVNVLGMMKLTRAVLPLMLEKRQGSIVNIGSEASLKASAAGAAYTTSKHAVVGLSKSSAFMYGPSGIRTNVVAPGGTLTNIEASFDSTLGAERVNEIIATMPDAVNADAVAASITFLLSDDSVNINGAVLPSDGGWSVQ